ncbi:MAG: hypothetical protein ACAI34_20745 [Verrucomicrobium sp.]
MSDKKQILIVRPGVIEKERWDQFAEAGYLVVECEEGAEPLPLMPGTAGMQLTGKLILLAALKALGGMNPKEKFAEEVMWRVEAEENRSKAGD